MAAKRIAALFAGCWLWASASVALAQATLFVAEDDGNTALHRWTILGPGDAVGSDHQQWGGPFVNRSSGFAFSSAVSPNELFIGLAANDLGGGGTIASIIRSTNPLSGTPPTIDDSRRINSPIGIANFSNSHASINVVPGGSGDLYIAGEAAGDALTRLTPTATGATVDYSLDLSFGARGATVSPWGEIFVSDFAGDTIHRFVDDGAGFVANGFFTHPTLDNPHGLVFRGNELFVGNYDSDGISRFTFTDDSMAGLAIFGSEIFGNGIDGPIDLAIAPWGELWVANQQAGPGTLSRFTFDSLSENALAAANGIFDPQFNNDGQGMRGAFGIAFFEPFVAAQQVPEPASLAAWSLLCVVGMIYLKWGRRPE